MSNLMEWVLVFFMLYIFASIWLISQMLESILQTLKEMSGCSKKSNEGKKG